MATKEKKEVREPVKMARILRPNVNVRKAPEGEIKFIAHMNEAYRFINRENGWVLTTKGYIREDLVQVEDF